MKQSITRFTTLKDVTVDSLNQRPFEVHIIPFTIEEDEQRILSESLYHALLESGYEVLIDDRVMPPGVKFADADLIGIPLRITVGKRINEGVVEVMVRSSGETLEINIENLVETIAKYVVK